MPTVLERINASQDQFIELATSWQKPVVAAVQRTARLVEGQAAKLPKLPLIDKLPKPVQFVEAQFAFVQKMLDSNKRFAVDVAEAVTPGEEVVETAKKASNAASRS